MSAGSNGSAEPQLAAATNASSGGGSAPIQDSCTAANKHDLFDSLGVTTARFCRFDASPGPDNLQQAWFYVDGKRHRHRSLLRDQSAIVRRSA